MSSSRSDAASRITRSPASRSRNPSRSPLCSHPGFTGFDGIGDLELPPATTAETSADSEIVYEMGSHSVEHRILNRADELAIIGNGFARDGLYQLKLDDGWPGERRFRIREYILPWPLSADLRGQRSHEDRLAGLRCRTPHLLASRVRILSHEMSGSSHRSRRRSLAHRE